MSAYVVAHGTVKNKEKMQEYASASAPTVENYRGKFVGMGACEVLSGDLQHKVMAVIEFQSIEAARGWYNSPEYQAIIPIREEALDSFFTLVNDD